MIARPLKQDALRTLAELDRKMDTGEVRFVRVEGSGHRAPIDDQIIAEFGLQRGQTVCCAIWHAILDFKLARLQGRAAVEKAMASARDIAATARKQGLL